MIKATAMKLDLDATPEFWKTDDATLAIMTGGCGPGRFGNFGLFDKAWGLSIKPACAIHDFDYGSGKTQENKRVADHRFLDNMIKIINKESKFELLRILRRYRAVSYYNMVVECGGSAFAEATL